MFSSHTSKPFYRYQRDFNYKKHQQKLNEIQNKQRKVTSYTSMQLHPKNKQIYSPQKKKFQKISQQNLILLTKLISISTRNSIQKINTNKKNNSNYFRKNWLFNIKKQNMELGSKLINARSSLSLRKSCKSANAYEKVKKSTATNYDNPKNKNITQPTYFISESPNKFNQPQQQNELINQGVCSNWSIHQKMHIKKKSRYTMKPLKQNKQEQEFF